MSIQEKRQELKHLSKEVRPLVLAEEYPTINAAIINEFYKSNEHQLFKKFSEWKKEGKTILKGAKAFAVWGQPKKQPKPKPEEETKEKFEFWPICYLFSNAQVK
jgi:hypothetical protein